MYVSLQQLLEDKAIIWLSVSAEFEPAANKVVLKSNGIVEWRRVPVDSSLMSAR